MTKQKLDLEQVGAAMEAIAADEALLSRVHSANPWFVPGLVQQAIEAMRPWWALPAAKWPAPVSARRVGIVMAGNVPFVGLHDLLSVLLCGHQAVLKLSSKDPLLIPALLDLLPPSLPVHTLDRLSPADIDFLLATGSDNTARYLQHDFAGLPQLIRKNRFSVAVLDGNESPADWNGLAKDILLYHGMGCRSVSNLLVTDGTSLDPLWEALERFPARLLAAEWQEVTRWELAVVAMRSDSPSPTRRLVPEFRSDLAPARVGALHLVPVRNGEEADMHLQAARDKIQCVVGKGREVDFGQSQRPKWDDFADGVNVAKALSQRF